MKHFTIQELTNSATAQRLGIANVPPPEAMAAMQRLVEQVLDPLREAWGRPLIVTSGYRGYRLNKAVKGSNTSAHCYALAADIIPADTNEMDEFKIFAPKFLKQSGLPYDQYIDESRVNEKAGGNVWVSEWCHFGYKDRKGLQRRQNLITKDGKKYNPLQ